MLRLRDEELMQLRTQHLSPSNIRISPENESETTHISEGGARTGLDFKLKPDTYDGSVLLREFFFQFCLISRANHWSKEMKAVALVSSLREKALRSGNFPGR